MIQLVSYILFFWHLNTYWQKINDTSHHLAQIIITVLHTSYNKINSPESQIQTKTTQS